jgi:regulator of RNase E activity RraA
VVDGPIRDSQALSSMQLGTLACLYSNSTCRHMTLFFCHVLTTVQGIVVDGPIRDSQAMSSMQLGTQACLYSNSTCRHMTLFLCHI